jgi:hypothetical protein
LFTLLFFFGVVGPEQSDAIDTSDDFFFTLRLRDGDVCISLTLLFLFGVVGPE